jgi:RHS repeat-associated protein
MRTRPLGRHRSAQLPVPAVEAQPSTSASRLGTTLGWSYDANGNRLQQTGASNASALSAAGTSFTFNGRGRMSSATVGSTTSNYIYNAVGQMIEKNVGGTLTVLVYDESGHLLGEYSGTGILIQETIWLGDIPVATIRPGASGSGVSVDYVHANQFGAPIMVSRPSDNAILWRWDTDPFSTAAPNQNPQSIGTFVYNLRFPGQYYQAETGLNYNHFRDYDPQTGKYVESDPIGLAGRSYSTYAYVGSSPSRRRSAPNACAAASCSRHASGTGSMRGHHY